MKLFHILTLSVLVLLASTVCKAQDDEEDIDDVEVEEEFEIEEEEVVVDDYVSPVPTGPTHLHENFDDSKVLHTRWRISTAKKDGVDDEIAKYDGEWAVESPQEDGLTGDLGLVLKSKAKHHAISAKLEKPFIFEEDPFIIQYEVKFQNGLDCGGAYVKLVAGETELEEFHDKTRYTIMFGPDKCGADSKLHFIFQHKNPVTGEFEEKHAKKPSGKFAHVFTDKKSHLFTLILDAENNFDILVDQTSVNSGNLLSDMTPAVNPPAEIEDPDDEKPEDWDDRKKIADPDATKPNDWDEDAPARIPDPEADKPEGWLDDEPEYLDDPDAEKPEDWDEEMDGEWEPPKIPNPKCEEAGCGEWEPPMINNPDFKGKWRAPMIDNADYSGQWSPRMIVNPNFFEDLEPFRMTSIGSLGLELWSMSDNIFFDNFIITSERDIARDWAASSWKLKAKKEGSGVAGDGIMQQFLKQTEERPWLWVVIGLLVVIPLFLCIRLCMRKADDDDETPAEQEETSEAKEGEAKEGEEEGEEGEEGEGDDEVDEKVDAEGDGSNVRQRKKSKKADLEQTSNSQDEAEEETEEKTETKEEVRKSPRQKKTRKE